MAAACNVSGVYTDQIACSHAEACYASSATSAGWAQGTQKLLTAMTEAVGPDRMLISESHDQMYIASLHAFLSIYGWLVRNVCSCSVGEVIFKECTWVRCFSLCDVNILEIVSLKYASPHPRYAPERRTWMFPAVTSLSGCSHPFRPRVPRYAHVC